MPEVELCLQDLRRRFDIDAEREQRGRFGVVAEVAISGAGLLPAAVDDGDQRVDGRRWLEVFLIVTN